MKTLLDREDLVFNPPESGCVLSLSELPGGGSKIYDRSPYGNIGTITGATWKRLPSGLWCLSFDGQDDYVNCGSDASIKPADGAFEMWVQTSAPATDQYFAGVNPESAVDRYNFGLQNSGYLRTYWDVDNEGYNSGNLHLMTAGTWYHYVVCFGSGGLKTYVNGCLEDENTSITTGLADLASTVAIVIGCNNPSGIPWNGLIGLVRIRNYALSALEIQNHFNQEKHLFGVW